MRRCGAFGGRRGEDVDERWGWSRMPAQVPTHEHTCTGTASLPMWEDDFLQQAGFPSHPRRRGRG